MELAVSYTKQEGGQWHKVPENTELYVPPYKILLSCCNHVNKENPTVKVPFLKPTYRNPADCVEIELHAFRTNQGRIWDCINGWRT